MVNHFRKRFIIKVSHFNFIFIAILINVIIVHSTHAKNGPPDGWSLGIGSTYSESIYAGVGYELSVFPLVSYKSGRFWLKGLSPSYQIFITENFTTEAYINPQLFGVGYEAKDSQALSGMNSRKGSLLLGVASKLTIKRINFELSLEQYIYDRHHGLKGQFLVGTAFPISIFFKQLPFTLVKYKIGGNYYSKSYSNYYFGVKPEESTVQRPAYSLDHSLNLVSELSVMTNWTEKISSTIGFTLEKSSNEVSKSPITIDSTTKSLRAFLTYSL